MWSLQHTVKMTESEPHGILTPSALLSRSPSRPWWKVTCFENPGIWSAWVFRRALFTIGRSCSQRAPGVSLAWWSCARGSFGTTPYINVCNVYPLTAGTWGTEFWSGFCTSKEEAHPSVLFFLLLLLFNKTMFSAPNQSQALEIEKWVKHWPCLPGIHDW